MNKFGALDNFSIWVSYYYITYKDDPEFLSDISKYEMGGDFYFWTINKNLFEYRDRGEGNTYGYDLTYLVEFFCEYLFYHISDDPFPVKTQSSDASSMMDEVALVKGDDSDLTAYLDVDWDSLDIELRSKIDKWNNRHGLLTNRGPSFLPDIYIRRVDDQVEISWSTPWAHDNGREEYYFEHVRGVDYVDIKLYKDTVVEFCLDFIDRFKEKYPERMQKYRDQLQKAIYVVV